MVHTIFLNLHTKNTRLLFVVVKIVIDTNLFVNHLIFCCYTPIFLFALLSNFNAFTFLWTKSICSLRNFQNKGIFIQV